MTEDNLQVAHFEASLDGFCEYTFCSYGVVESF